MLGDLGVDQFFSQRLERGESALFVDAHEAAIAGDVSREDGCQPPLDTRLGHEKVVPIRSDFRRV
jgi:hypothetical protein